MNVSEKVLFILCGNPIDSIRYPPKSCKPSALWHYWVYYSICWYYDVEPDKPDTVSHSELLNISISICNYVVVITYHHHTIFSI